MDRVIVFGADGREQPYVFVGGDELLYVIVLGAEPLPHYSIVFNFLNIGTSFWDGFSCALITGGLVEVVVDEHVVIVTEDKEVVGFGRGVRIHVEVGGFRGDGVDGVEVFVCDDVVASVVACFGSCFGCFLEVGVAFLSCAGGVGVEVEDDVVGLFVGEEVTCVVEAGDGVLFEWDLWVCPGGLCVDCGV